MIQKRLVLILFVGVVLGSLSRATAEVTPSTVWTGEARSLLPLWVQYWIYFMFLMTATGLVFVKNHVEARWAVGAFVASHLASGCEILVFGADSFVVGMIAINHCIFWTPAAIYLASMLKKDKRISPFRVWHLGMLGVFVFSLLFDYRDAAIYLTSMFGVGETR